MVRLGIERGRMRMSFRYRKQFFRKDKGPLPARKKYFKNCGGRISASASLTLEASLVLPLFFFAVLAMLYFTDVVTLEVRLMKGLRETGRTLALAAAGKGIAGIEDEEDLGLAGVAVSSVYARQSVSQSAGKLPEQILDGGISLLGSSFLEDEMIDLKVSAKVKIPVPFFNIRSIRAWQRGYVRAWTGRAPKSAGSEEGGEDGTAYVYVTATGSVYHTDLNCTHIKLSIQQVNRSQVPDMRSADGSKYYPCSCYNRSPSEIVYITSEGNRYHSSLECSGLKRTVKKVELTEAEGMRACSRCGE